MLVITEFYCTLCPLRPSNNSATTQPKQFRNFFTNFLKFKICQQMSRQLSKSHLIFMIKQPALGQGYAILIRKARQVWMFYFTNTIQLLTPGVNFTNILWAVFLYGIQTSSSFVPKFRLCFSQRKKIGAKAGHKMLVITSRTAKFYFFHIRNLTFYIFFILKHQKSVFYKKKFSLIWLPWRARKCFKNYRNHIYDFNFH